METKGQVMGKWQNLEKAFLDGVGEYDIPEILPVYELPDINKWIEFDYCNRYRSDRYDRSRVGVHFFEDDYKFERIWTSIDRYAEQLQQFGCVMSPDFSMYIDFPKAVRIYNKYRNHYVARYYQECYNMTVIPTIMFGFEDSYDWVFDGYPKESIVAISTVGLLQDKEMRNMFLKAYNEMMSRLQPSKILLFTRQLIELPGDVEYIRWELHKGDQLNGKR